MPKGKTRIVIKSDDSLRKVLSVLQRPNGDLLLHFPHVENFQHPVRGEVKIREMRWSLHTSSRSEGETVKFTLGLTDGTMIDNGAFHIARKNDRFWPIFATPMTDRSDQKFLAKINGNDLKVILDEYDQSSSTMILLILASGSAAPDIKHDVLNTLRLKYSSFDLHLVWGYLWIPPLIHSGIYSFATSGIRENQQFVLPFRRNTPHPGLTAEEIPDASIGVFSQIVGDLWENVQKHYQDVFIPSDIKLVTTLRKSPYKPTRSGDL